MCIWPETAAIVNSDLKVFADMYAYNAKLSRGLIFAIFVG